MAPMLKPDVREEILKILRDPKGVGNTNAAIARMVGCDEGSVRRIRLKIDGEGIHMKNGVKEQISIDSIRLDPDTQPRAEIDDGLIKEYVQEWKDKANFPPVIVFREDDGYILGDGFHRTISARKAGRKSILADVREGGKRAAILYSVGANAAHGMRRTNEDKRRAVMTLLNDEEWHQRSDNWIAQQCGVSPMTVGRHRSDPNYNIVIVGPTQGQDGKVRDTSNIGRKPALVSAPNGTPATSPGSPAATEAEPNDSMSANPETEDEVPSETESIDDQPDAEAIEPTYVQQVGRAERQGASAAVEEVKGEQPATEVKADPEAEFLTTCPLYSQLEGYQRDKFRQAALVYLRTRELRTEMVKIIRGVVDDRKIGVRSPLPVFRLSQELKWEHPRDWRRCLGDPSVGHCHIECQMCKGEGFHHEYHRPKDRR